MLFKLAVSLIFFVVFAVWNMIFNLVYREKLGSIREHIAVGIVGTIFISIILLTSA